jgi:uncharacterized protein YlbG (UPF0298 family)
MSVAKTLFDVLYAAKEDVVQAMQKPSREKMIKRVAERIADRVEDRRIEVATRISDLKHKLVNTKDEDEAESIYDEIVTLQLDIEEAVETAKAVMAVKDELFSPAEEPLK